MSVKLTYSIARIGPCNFWAIPMCGKTLETVIDETDQILRNNGYVSAKQVGADKIYRWVR